MNQNGIMTREVERHDGRDHAERLADHHFVDARRDVLVVDALHQRRNAAGDLDVLDGAPHFGDALAVGLAALLGDGSRQIVCVLFEERLQLE